MHCTWTLQCSSLLILYWFFGQGIYVENQKELRWKVQVLCTLQAASTCLAEESHRAQRNMNQKPNPALQNCSTSVLVLFPSFKPQSIFLPWGNRHRYSARNSAVERHIPVPRLLTKPFNQAATRVPFGFVLVFYL